MLLPSDSDNLAILDEPLADKSEYMVDETHFSLIEPILPVPHRLSNNYLLEHDEDHPLPQQINESVNPISTFLH